MQLVLEILTGICATLPDPDLDPVGEAVEEEDSENAEGEADVSGDDGMELDQMNKDAQDTAPPSSTVSNTSLLPTILTPLLNLIQPTPLSFPPLPSVALRAPTHSPTTSALSSIHIRALECLNNIFLSIAVSASASAVSPSSAIHPLDGDNVAGVSEDVQSGLRVWDAIWVALGLVGTEGGRGQERRKEMWEAAVGVLWGIGSIWKGKLVGFPPVLFSFSFLSLSLEPITSLTRTQIWFRFLMPPK